MKLKYALFGLVGVASIVTSCELDEKFYSKVTPDNFFTAPENTYAVLG